VCRESKDVYRLTKGNTYPVPTREQQRALYLGELPVLKNHMVWKGMAEMKGPAVRTWLQTNLRQCKETCRFLEVRLKCLKDHA